MKIRANGIDIEVEDSARYDLSFTHKPAVLLIMGLGLQRVPGRVVQAVDATGAGDCFDGNLLARLALGDAPVAAVRYANTAASLAVQGYGAVAPLPTAAAVRAVLAD